MDEQEYVNVSIRIKPQNNKGDNSPCLQLISKQPPVLVMPDRSHTFHFDNIFDENEDQGTIYKKMVQPMVEYVKQGYNCTVFAYGQTGTGKTFTIGTNPQVRDGSRLGLIPRTLIDFFRYKDDEYAELEISVSFVEIYNEKVFDLLQNSTIPPLQVKGLKAQGFCQEKVFNSQEARHFLEMGNKNRHTGETKQNSNSSRSHAIFTIYCNVKHRDHETEAKLNLVDLAGSESVKKTGNQGSSFQEGININKGLLSISQVMTALSANSGYIPYRQSMITSILQDSLNRRNFISLIACISSLSEDSTETFQTLEFAQRVKRIKSKPEVSEIISEYKRCNPNVFQQSRVGSTPFKRCASNLYQTPHIPKKMKSLEVSSDSSSTRNSEPSPKSLSSLSSIPSVSNFTSDLTQQSISPVFRKYMTVMMNQMEDMIKSTLKRPSREALLMKEENKENDVETPCSTWNKIQNEVSKLVRTEVAQLTVRTNRATSSPIQDIRKSGRVLVYDSPSDENVPDKPPLTLNIVPDDNCLFKIPDLPGQMKKVRPKNLPISPIENGTVKPRCSVYDSPSDENVPDNPPLTSNIAPDDNCLFKVPDLPGQMKKVRSKNLPISPIDNGTAKPRRSVRLYTKTLNNNSILTICDNTLDCSSDLIRVDNKTKKLDINGQTTRNKKAKSAKSRIQPSRCSQVPKLADTPAGKRLLKMTRNDSPLTTRTKYVLGVLNEGNLRELEKLNSVGPKTAQQIYNFREIKGKLNAVSDLTHTLGWGIKKFEKFVVENVVKKELV